MATEPTTEALSQHGDVILNVGKAPKTQRKLLVSSVLLSHASPVFAAMFSGRFAEGQSLTSDSPRAIPLPDDDADAMATVCKIIHIQVMDLGATTTPAKLVSMALVAHKYDCVEAVKAWSIIWLAPILKQPNAAGFESTLLATYLLDLAPKFLEVSKSLIRDRSELFSAPAMSHGQDFLSRSIFERIIEARNKAQKMALAALGPLAMDTECIDLQAESAFYFRELRRIGLWPIGQFSVAQIKDGLQQMQNSDFEAMCDYDDCDCQYPQDPVEDVLADVTQIYDTVRGLCLDCVKKFELGVSRTKCRVKCDGALFAY